MRRETKQLRAKERPKRVSSGKSPTRINRVHFRNARGRLVKFTFRDPFGTVRMVFGTRIGRYIRAYVGTHRGSIVALYTIRNHQK